MTGSARAAFKFKFQVPGNLARDARDSRSLRLRLPGYLEKVSASSSHRYPGTYPGRNHDSPRGQMTVLPGY
eukprot:1522145-Rhodomonas_salina.2